MRQPRFSYLLVVFIPIALLMHQVLHLSSSFSMLPDFFYLILLFFINNRWWRCQLLMLSFELWFCTSCQQILIEDIVNHPSFWKLQFKCFRSNGLYLLLFSFFEGRFEWIFLFSSHMLLPTFNSWGFFLFLSNCFFIFFCTSSIALVACFQLFCNPIRKSSTHRMSIFTMRSHFQGCLPKFNLNGVLPVAACLLSLYWNSAAANQFVQLSCWLL